MGTDVQLAKHTIWIDRARDDVWRFFTDLDRASAWRRYVVAMTALGDGTIRVGSRIQTTVDVMGRRHTFELEVLQFDPPAVWRHRTFESDFNGFIEYRFEPEAGGTRVTMTIVARPKGLYGWLTLPVMLLRPKPYREQLPQLKRAMEG